MFQLYDTFFFLVSLSSRLSLAVCEMFYKTISGAFSDLGIGWERITLLLQKKVHSSTLQTSFYMKLHMALRLVQFISKF